MIGFCTAIIGDVASHLGCFIFLKDTVNAIAFVALGTSVPGLYNLNHTRYASHKQYDISNLEKTHLAHNGFGLVGLIRLEKC